MLEKSNTNTVSVCLFVFAYGLLLFIATRGMFEFVVPTIGPTARSKFFHEMGFAEKAPPTRGKVLNVELSATDVALGTRFMVRVVAHGQFRIVGIDCFVTRWTLV